MGTSKSFGGPGGKPPLLPAWATGPLDGDSPTEPADLGDDPDSMPVEPADSADAPDGSPTQPAEKDDGEAEASASSWSSAKRSFGAAVSARGGGGGRGGGYSSAGRSYVKALGGSKKAASGATSGRRASQAFGAFLADVANRGLAGAMESLGLGEYVGKDPEIAVAAIANAIAPAGETREAAAARFALNEAMVEFYKNATETPDATARVGSMSADAMATAMKTVVASYIYRRWVSDLGVKIEQNAISRHAAVRLEKQVKVYVRDAVKFDMQGKDILRIDWKRGEGRSLIDRVYRDAYELLGGGVS